MREALDGRVGSNVLPSLSPNLSGLFHSKNFPFKKNRETLILDMVISIIHLTSHSKYNHSQYMSNSYYNKQPITILKKKNLNTKRHNPILFTFKTHQLKLNIQEPAPIHTPKSQCPVITY